MIGEQRCPVAADLAPGAVAAWYAVVRPADRNLTTVQIEFHDRSADGVLIEERSLSFAARDSQKSRLASIGSVIAALAAAREGALSAPPPRKVSEPAPAPLDLPLAPPAPVPPPDWGIDIAGLVAPTFGDGPSRAGGLARLRWGFGGSPFVLLSGRYAVHSGNPSFGWWALAAGAGLRLGERDSSFNLELSGEAVFERTHIHADDGTASDSVGQSGWGGRVGVDAVWATWRHCSLILGVDGSVVLPRINVVVGNQAAASVPSASVGLFLGLRFQP